MANNPKEKVRDLHDEIWYAKKFVENIINTLECCDVYKKQIHKIGIFARQIPEFKYLSDERIYILSILRRAAAGEITVAKALELFRQVQKQLSESLDYFRL